MSAVTQWVAPILGAALAGALMSFLLYTVGRAHELPEARLRRAATTLWVALVLCVAGLAGARAALGGGIMDYDARGDSPLAVRSLQGHDALIVAAGLAWTAIWMVVALRAAKSVTGALPPPGAPPDTDSDTQEREESG